jgi:glycosyltransferase involved in cell wall biosynthesis
MISILIPLYNGIEFLEQSLNSVINQTYNEWEVIIGINGHPFNSLIEQKANFIKENIAKNDNRIRIIYYNTNGKSATLNAMKKNIIYNYIALLDVDDIWHYNKLEKQIPYIENYHVVGTLCRYFGNQTHSPEIPVEDISLFNFLKVNPIINSSAIVHKSCFDIDENSKLEDYELWLKLRYKDKKFYNVPEILCFHRIHDDSAFNNTNNDYLDGIKQKWLNIFIHKKI